MIKYETFIIKTFDHLKNDNFDQVNFGQMTPCRLNWEKINKNKNAYRLRVEKIGRKETTI